MNEKTLRLAIPGAVIAATALIGRPSRLITLLAVIGAGAIGYGAAKNRFEQ